MKKTSNNNKVLGCNCEKELPILNVRYSSWDTSNIEEFLKKHPNKFLFPNLNGSYSIGEKNIRHNTNMYFGKHKCCICGKEFYGWGNNPDPFPFEDGERCCNHCDMEIVIPMRIGNEMVDVSRNGGFSTYPKDYKELDTESKFFMNKLNNSSTKEQLSEIFSEVLNKIIERTERNFNIVDEITPKSVLRTFKMSKTQLTDIRTNCVYYIGVLKKIEEMNKGEKYFVDKDNYYKKVC